jgi:hypothetical protein
MMVFYRIIKYLTLTSYLAAVPDRAPVNVSAEIEIPYLVTPNRRGPL